MSRLESSDATTSIGRRTDLLLTAAVLGSLALAGLTLAITGTTD